MDLRVSGSSMLSREVPENALSPMEIIPSGKTNSLRGVQPSKHQPGISVRLVFHTAFQSDKSQKLLHLQKQNEYHMNADTTKEGCLLTSLAYPRYL